MSSFSTLNKLAVLALILMSSLTSTVALRAQANSGFAQAGQQQGPKAYSIISIDVQGVEDETTRFFVIRNSGLKEGEQITVPGDESIAKAIKTLYRLGMFSDVRVVAEKFVGEGVYLQIQVTKEPRLSDYTFEGAKRGQQEDLRKKLPLLRGQSVKPSDVERSIQLIKNYYTEKGYPLAQVEVEKSEIDNDRVSLKFDVEKGDRIKVQDIKIKGNDSFSNYRIRKKLKETKKKRWWRFWKRETFEESKFQDDLSNVIDFYNQKGFYDARVVADSAYIIGVEENDPHYMVELSIEEGPQYHIRNVSFDGNTHYTDEQLRQSLGFQKGDVYNSRKLQSNLYGNPRNNDIGSLYYNQGYVQFQVAESITEVNGDSLDLSYEVVEGDIFKVGDVKISGNSKTKEHVVRRVIYTLPGNTFSREGIQRSLRELAQLGYFNQESLIPDTRINPETKTVDITYPLEETGGDQLEFSGGWGGFGGLLLQAGVTFKNFSLQNLFNKEAYRPLPSGDGQQLSLGVQVQGRFYQNYYLSFQEPWFRGLPRPVGLSLSQTRYDLGAQTSLLTGISSNSSGGVISISSASLSYGRQLKVPDDYFSTGSILKYRLYNLGDRSIAAGLPIGQNQSLSFTQSLSRNSLDHPQFPSAGSQFLASVEIAPPLPGFVQYHKWTLNTSWNLPLAGKNGKLSLGLTANYGYVGTLTGERVAFERYIVGGTPFDSQTGRFGYGRDIVYMRGFPPGAIGPRDASNAFVGGAILNKYNSELKYLAVQSPQFSMQSYIFLDAAGSYDNFGSYNPANLHRAVGVGARVFLPILGMITLNYGRNLDAFPSTTNDDGSQKWRFQFSLGQSF